MDSKIVSVRQGKKFISQNKIILTGWRQIDMLLNLQNKKELEIVASRKLAISSLTFTDFKNQ